jgi:uncharacterized damage-inducible protein DinB
MTLPLKAAILDYTKYNHWANVTLTDWLKSMDVELLHREVKSSFTSIDLTLQHMKNAQNFWYAVVTGADIDFLDEQLRIDSSDWVIEELLKGSHNLVDLVALLNENDLLSKVSSPAMTKTTYEFLLHAINHNSYHRGQIITISRSLGIRENIPNTDYDSYLWLRIDH